MVLANAMNPKFVKQLAKHLHKNADQYTDLSLRELTDSAEEKLLEYAYATYPNNKKRAARELGCPRPTYYARVKSLFGGWDRLNKQKSA